MLLVIDNYDSFTFNLVQYLSELGGNVEVYRNDKISIAQLSELSPERIMISPGPGTPNDAGISMAIIEAIAGKIPLLGVCLGHQCIGQVYGVKSPLPQILCTASYRWFITTTAVCSPIFPRPFRQRVTTHWWSIKPVYPSAWKSLPGHKQPMVKSMKLWAFDTKHWQLKEFNSTPNR